jgi:pimeloyl-ACP methyl ester carboxylesterase
MSGTRAVRHEVTSNADLRLHRLDYGGEGRPVVCLHGVTGHAWVWHDAAGDLVEAGAGRVLAVDLRGHGDSQWSAGGAYGTDDHIEDLAAVLDDLAADEVDLAGSSWGGLVALGYAARNPGRVRHLALVDIEPSFEQGETDVFPRPTSFATHAEAAAWERQQNPNAPDSMIEIMAAHGTRPGPEGQLHRKHDPYFFERWPFRADDRWEELRSLALPVLVLHASQTWVRGEVAERMARETGNGRFVQMEDSAHLIPVEQPNELARVLASFFAED